MLPAALLDAEWLETDGLGGFASGTVAGWRNRRYHGLLIPAIEPPTRRAVLLNGFDAWVDGPGWSVPLSAQRYQPAVVSPNGHDLLTSFNYEPWPTWVWRLPGAGELRQEVLMPAESGAIVVRWSGKQLAGTRLRVRPFLSGRDSHALHHQNDALNPSAAQDGERVGWRTYPSMPTIASRANAMYRHDPVWYRDFHLQEEEARGFDHTEDAFSPGELTWDLEKDDAAWILQAEELPGSTPVIPGPTLATARKVIAAEMKRRGAWPSPLHRAASAYFVRRGDGQTIIAGYPWFTDWGRDTFIALRGLALAGDRLDDAREILLQWAGSVSQGQLPNRFVEAGDAPEFNAVDASLWFIIAAHEYLELARARGKRVKAADRSALEAATTAILTGYEAGTRFGIRAAASGLLEAGAPGVQLTWMDARVGDWVVTPRWGKPVEVQALWLNALRIGAGSDGRWSKLLSRGLAAFRNAFWYAPGGYLADVVDVEGQAGQRDLSFRPNQILAVGGLPHPLIEGEMARQVVDAVEARLWTPLGLRSLAPGEKDYHPRYQGGPRERDGAYHQGTVWPWLIGPFVEAWVRVRGGTAKAKAEARQRFLTPLFAHLGEAGLGHVSEIADAELPHIPRGCPFQAWSVGELLRLDQQVLAVEEPRPARRSSRATTKGG